MNAKLLTELGWKTVAVKCKVKDNGLQRALANYEKLDEEKYDERIKAIGVVCQLANALTKVKDLAEDADKHQEQIDDAREGEKKDNNKRKAVAERTDSEAKKKEALEAKKAGDEDEDEDEEEDADYKTKLWAAFQKLKTMRDIAFQF